MSDLDHRPYYYAESTGLSPPEFPEAYIEVKVTYHNGTVTNMDVVLSARCTQISRSGGYDLGLATNSLGGTNGKIEIRMRTGQNTAAIVIGTRQVNNSTPPPVYTNLGPTTLSTTYTTYNAQTGTTWQDQFRLWRLTS